MTTKLSDMSGSYLRRFIPLIFLAMPARGQLHYILSCSDSTTGRLHITISSDTPLATPISFVLPRSVPGDYGVVKYDLFVGHLQATGINGSTSRFHKDEDGAPRWVCNDTNFKVKSIQYEVDRKLIQKLKSFENQPVKGCESSFSFSQRSSFEPMQRFPQTPCHPFAETPHMRKLLFLLPGLLAISTLFGQKTEFGLSLNSGLFSFAGRGSTGTSAINSTANFSNYTNDPYGSKVGWCDGLSADLKRISRRHLLWGLSFGYEALRSRLSLTSINVFNGVDAYSLTAHGHTDLVSRFINLYPSAGYRFTPGRLTLDLTGGLDLAYCLSAAENGKAYASNGATFSSSRDRKTISADIRRRLEVSVGIHRTAVYVGYSYGLTNYMAGYIGGPGGASSRLLRFGLQYWL